MKIKSLTLHGFKSFADRTRIDLHEGITAIVGPNGCGKSNVADAIRWVLGEQRPTAIRGTRMEEAIFGGTEQRRPIHRAEVDLEISNEDGALAVPYSQVVMGRTVYRGGEGEYSLNGAGCRLRDIQDLCRDTGLGANAYAIIEGRMIDAILSDRAEERRALFEEAAEVGRYKARRRTALRRLEQAEADLQRLNDLLHEVESKVRSLAQQRGRAQRFVELRARRLQLEVAVTDVQLARSREEAAAAEEELAALRSLQTGEQTALQTAETEAEALRLRLTERERERSGTARQLEEVRQRLEERERERLVAEERIAAAERRAAKLEEELKRLAARDDELREELERASERLRETEEAVAALSEKRAERRAEVETLNRARGEEGAREEAARQRLAEVWRRLDQLEAEGRATEERLTDQSAEVDRWGASLREIERLETELRAQLSRAEKEAGEARKEEDRLNRELENGRSEALRLREVVRELRNRVGSLEGDHASAVARRTSLASLLSSGADLPRVVADLIQASVAGVHGVLADSIRAAEEIGPAVEIHLGPYLHAVLVDDWAAVERVRAWLEDREADGGLVLLPLEPGPRGGEVAADGSRRRRLSELVELDGPGAGWARALLETVSWEPERELGPAASSWIRADGVEQDPAGAVRIGQPGPGRGVLTRRDELERLERLLLEQEKSLEKGRAELEGQEARLGQAEGKADELERLLREATRSREEAEARGAGIAERLERLAEERAEITGRIDELRESLHLARTRSESSAEMLARLQSERESARGALAEAKGKLKEAEESWEAERGAFHDLELEVTRGEAGLAAAKERVEQAQRTLRDVEERTGGVREERSEQDRIVERCRSTLDEGEEEVLELLERRRGLEEELRGVEEALSEQRVELEEREQVLREARREERDHTERRHGLELLVTELRARQAALLERLEAEWDAPLEALREEATPPGEGTPEEWEAELEEVRRRLGRLGPVNLLAEEEYGNERERLDFLRGQQEDLVEARDDLRDSIRRINRKASEALLETFEQVRGHFRRTFETLFEGGECDMWIEDPQHPLDSPIEISASPRGKRTQRIHLLSGGERALTALALLFAIYLAKPSPFCLMDEVDAPLDETNVLRFVSMLEQFKKETQFIVITHNPRTIEAADWIYGVTMQEPGVSSVIGVRFGEPSDQVA